MNRYTCIGCGAEITGTNKPASWHTITVQVDDVGSRTTAKIRLLDFCVPCYPVAQRFADAMCAMESAVPRAVTSDEVATFDERPAIMAVPVLLVR